MGKYPFWPLEKHLTLISIIFCNYQTQHIESLVSALPVLYNWHKISNKLNLTSYSYGHFETQPHYMSSIIFFWVPGPLIYIQVAIRTQKP